MKSIAAYRVGLDLDPLADLGRGRRGRRGWDGRRLDDPVLIRMTLAAAVELGLSIQFHIGFGDADIRMAKVDPTLLTDWLHRHRVPVTLLHCWPYQRQAGWLALHPHVHPTSGWRCTTSARPGRRRCWPRRPSWPCSASCSPRTRTAARSSTSSARSPSAARSARLLTERVEAGEWSAADATRIARLIGHGNAESVYDLK